jgi:dimethylglycine dehydrogenase
LWYDISRARKHTLTFRREQPWLDVVKNEVHAVRTHVGLMDLPGFTKFMIAGPGAAAFLDRLVCSRLPRLNRISLAYVLNTHGRIVSEFTLTRLGPQKFYAVSAATAEFHDDDVLTQRAPADGSVAITRLSEEVGTLVLAGPKARDVLMQVTRSDLSNAAFPWLSARQIEIGSAGVLALRINYVGELGWELHAPTEHLPAIYAVLLEAGKTHRLQHFGMYAMDSLRIDKCYPGWKSDLETGVSPFEASLDRFVDLTKPAFVGKDALVAEQSRDGGRRLVPLLLDDAGIADAPYCSTIFAGDEPVGIATSGVWSHTLERSVALAYVRRDLAAPGTRLHIDILGERRAATVGRGPLFDPENTRARS